MTLARKPIKEHNFKTSHRFKKLSKAVEKKAEYTATPFACGWAGAIFEVTRAFGQEQCGQRKKTKK